MSKKLKTVGCAVTEECYEKIEKRMNQLNIKTKNEYFKRLLKVDLEYGGVIRK